MNGFQVRRQFFQRAYQFCQPCNVGPTDQATTTLKDQIILDSGSGVKATFMNRDMVHDIKPSKEPIVMATNAGATLLDKSAEVPGWGQVHFHEDGMANIFGLSHTVQMYRVTFDSEVENAFIVHHPNCLLYTSPSPRDLSTSRMPSSA